MGKGKAINTRRAIRGNISVRYMDLQIGRPQILQVNYLSNLTVLNTSDDASIKIKDCSIYLIQFVSIHLC